MKMLLSQGASSLVAMVATGHKKKKTGKKAAKKKAAAEGKVCLPVSINRRTNFIVSLRRY